MVNKISERIDPHFDVASTKYIVPQDSGMSTSTQGAINWFKDVTGSLGSIATWDMNSDGYMDRARITLSYIIYNNRAIVQEGLSARVAPGEVGITSSIAPDKTVLHINTPRSLLQPADIWLVNLAKNYAPKTSFYVILPVDYFESTFSKYQMKKNESLIKNSE